ncbi:MAG: hypothetical protein DRR19_19785 [Candidatus Parabeggiatoa sp. nov. 1]|nr:MAG: hypothetical protein DRR19_19785 [Gammaproteobacteria bacterium]
MNLLISLLSLALLLSLNTAQATEPLEVAPKQIWSKPNQEHQFWITGGLRPIFWQSKAGEVSVDEKEPNLFIYMAPRRYMQDSITFFDRAGQEVQVLIDVLRPLSVSPSIRNIPINGETHFQIQGGSGHWQVKPEVEEHDNILTITKSDNMTLTIQAGSSGGLQTIRIHDEATEDEVEVQVQIYAPLEVQESLGNMN